MIGEFVKTFDDFSVAEVDTKKALAVTAAGAAGCYSVYRLIQSMYSRSPPGPVGVPGLGILPQILWRSATNPKHRMFRLTNEIAQKYGSVASFRMGTQEFVILSDYDVIRDALVTKGDRFSERPHTMLHEFMNKGNHGVVGSDGPLWQEHRRFALRVLRDFGFGKNVSELRIKEECEHLVTMLRQKDQQEVDFNGILPKAVANIISLMLFSQRNSFEDPGMDELLGNFSDLVHATLVSSLGLLFPELRILNATERLLIGNQQRRASQWLNKNCLQRLEQIRETFDHNEEPSNYIEAYLAQQALQSDDKTTTFTDTQLVITMRDLYIAGTDTTSNTLCWALLYSALHPEYQERCHKEIVGKIGSRQASLKDKKDLPYCMAFLDEVQRLSTLVPLSVEHRVSEDTELNGFTISSKAIIFINLYGVHHDPHLFPDPDVFDPARFLDESGDYKASEFLIPFSVGRRSCLGEALAKMELFLFFVSLVQNLKFEATEETLNQQEQVLLGTEGIIHSPMPHKLRVRRR